MLVIDMQEKLLPAVSNHQFVLENIKKLLSATDLLKIPAKFSEHYPKGLGRTVPVLLKEGDVPVEKVSFSILGAEGLISQIQDMKKKHVIVCGLEAHICILQSVMDLLSNLDGWIYVVADAVGARTDDNRRLGIARMEKAGAHIVSTEMVIFEWLEKAGTPEFKELSKLVK